MKEAAAALLALSVVAFTTLPLQVDATNAHLEWCDGRLLLCGQHFTGTVVDGLQRCEFQDGLRHGVDFTMSSGGSVVQRRNWYRGRRDGIQSGWYQSGRPWYYRMYRGGLPHGRAYEWYDAPGSPLSRASQYDHGHEVGRQRMWRPDGTLQVNYIVADQAAFGLRGSKECHR